MTKNSSSSSSSRVSRASEFFISFRRKKYVKKGNNEVS